MTPAQKEQLNDLRLGRKTFLVDYENSAAQLDMLGQDMDRTIARMRRVSAQLVAIDRQLEEVTLTILASQAAQQEVLFDPPVNHVPVVMTSGNSIEAPIEPTTSTVVTALAETLAVIGVDTAPAATPAESSVEHDAKNPSSR